MKIDLTHRQFELLLQLVYMGRYCHGIVERPETMTAEEGELIHLVNKFNLIAFETEGLKHLASLDPDGRVRASLEVEQRTVGILQEANDKLLDELLASHLANDEIERVYGDLPKNTIENYTIWSRLYEAAYEPILAELQQNELKNIRLHLP